MEKFRQAMKNTHVQGD